MTVLVIRVIPQGTVYNNLGPDRLAGPKALDPNYCRQPTLWLSGSPNCAWYWVAPIFGQRHSPYSYYKCRASDRAAVGTTFYVFNYDAVWAENWTHNFSNTGRMRYQLCHRHLVNCSCNIGIQNRRAYFK